MKQIGARQEAGRIGGIGACGRELCCASWVSSFSSVTTNAARVQDISLNPQKLAGQCSKLKCCLMYEYDVYADARQSIPRVREPLQAMDGEYYLVKTDILAHTMSFSSSKDAMVNVVTIPTSRVREIIAANRAGRKVDSIVDKNDMPTIEEPTFRTEEDSITRFDNQNRRRRNRRQRDKGGRQRNQEATSHQHSEGAEQERPMRHRNNRYNRYGDGQQNAEQREGREMRENREHREGREMRDNREQRERRDRRRNNRPRRQEREGGEHRHDNNRQEGHQPSSNSEQ
jgi:hypothetical protein